MNTSGHQSKLPDEIWKDFCRRLEETGKIIAGASIAETELDQAEGYRYLTRLLRIALDMHLENADTDFPSFYAASHETAKIGADNPDNIYMNASIDGKRNYRISGNRGNVPVLSFASKANRYAVDGTMASTGELDSKDMEFHADGSFEIIASQKKVPGNWLPLAEDSSMFLLRQTFLDRSTERPATATIKAMDPPQSTPDPLSLEFLAGGLDRALAFVEGTAKTFLQWSEQFKDEQYNRLATTDQEMFFRAGGDPTIFYLHGYWKLNSDEALEIKTSVPKCSFWNFQCDNVWMESLDYRHHQIHVNKHTARYDDDGSLTIVIADKDPGYGNWIDTAGHKQGTMLLRWIGAEQHPVPNTKVIEIKC